MNAPRKLYISTAFCKVSVGTCVWIFISNDRENLLKSFSISTKAPKQMLLIYCRVDTSNTTTTTTTASLNPKVFFWASNWSSTYYLGLAICILFFLFPFFHSILYEVILCYFLYWYVIFYNLYSCYFGSFSTLFHSLNLNQITLSYQCINHSHLNMIKPFQEIIYHFFIKNMLTLSLSKFPHFSIPIFPYISTYSS